MRSITGIKDLDIYLVDFLDDKNLSTMCCLNKYYNNILDENFFRRRYEKKYKNKSDVKNIKKHYLENERYLNVKTAKEKEESLMFAIYSDRYDLFSFSITLHWEKDLLNNRTLIDRIIKADSIKCYLLTSNKKEFDMPLAIIEKSEKIIYYLFKNIEYEDIISEVNIYTSLLNDSPYLINLYIENEKDMRTNEVIGRILWEPKFLIFTKKYNKALHLFLSTLSRDELRRIKNLALQRDRHEVIKLFTIYTSPFSLFSALKI